MSDPSEPSVQPKNATPTSSVIQEPGQETPTFMEPPQEALTSVDPPQEALTSADPPQEIPISSELPREIPISSVRLQEIPVSPEPPKEILTSLELLEEITISSEPSQERPTSSELLQEIPVSPEPPKEILTSLELLEEITISSEPSQERPTSSELLQEIPVSPEPPKEILTSLELLKEITISSEPSQERPTSSEVLQELPISSEPQVIPISSELPQEIPISPEPPKEVLTSSEFILEIPISSELPQEATILSIPPEEGKCKPPEEIPTSSEPAEQISTSSQPLERVLTSSEPPQERPTSSEPTEEMLATSDTSQESSISPEHTPDILTSSVPVQEVLTTSISPASDEVPSTSVTRIDSKVKPHIDLMPHEISSSKENTTSAQLTDTNTPMGTEILIYDSADLQTPCEMQLETVPVLPCQTSSVPTLHEITSAVQPIPVNLDSLSMQSVIPSPAVLNPEVEGTPAVTVHVCIDEPSEPHSLQALHRSMMNYRSSLEEDHPSRNIGTARGPELIEGIAKSRIKQNPGPSMAMEDPISDQSIFSEATEYEEEFILTENMVNSYTFSEESKSTDYSNSDSPMESGKSIANEDIIAAGLSVELIDMDEKSDHVVNFDVIEKNELSDEKTVAEEKQKNVQDDSTDNVEKSADHPFKLDETVDNVVNNGNSDVTTKPVSEQASSVDEKSENIADVQNAVETHNIDEKPDNVVTNDNIDVTDQTILTNEPASAYEKSSVDVDEEAKTKQALRILDEELLVKDCEKEDLLNDHENMNEDDLLNISDEVVEESEISEKSTGADSRKVSEDKISEKQDIIPDIDPLNASKVIEPMEIPEKEDEQLTHTMEDEDMEIGDPIEISYIIEEKKSTEIEKEIEQHKDINTDEQMEIDESVEIPGSKNCKKADDLDSEEKQKKDGIHTVKTNLDKVDVANLEVIEKNTSAKCSESEKTKTVKTPNIESNVAGPSSVEKGSGDSSDGMLALEDTLGLFTEGRAMLREDEDSDEEEEDYDDDNNEDDESNPMAPDSSEVESNAPVNEEAEVDQSEDDPEQTNQSEAVIAPPEEDIDQSLESIAQAVMDFGDDEDGFGFTIASVAGGDEEKSTDTTTKAEKAKESPKRSVKPKAAVPKNDAAEKSVEPTGIDTPVDADLEPAKEVDKADQEKDETVKTTEVAENQHKEPSPPLKSPTIEPIPERRPETPSKPKKLEIAKPGNVMNIVELESSSDSDVQESYKAMPAAPVKSPSPPADEVSETTSVNLPKDIDIMSTSCGDTSSIISNKAENVISGLPAPSPVKKTAARINTSEITIKTTGKPAEAPTITIPDEVEEKTEQTEERREKRERKAKKDKKSKPTFSLEVFNIDSDEEEKKSDSPKKLSAIELQKALDTKKCVNYVCNSDRDVEYVPAPSFVLSYYEVKRSRRCSPLVCMPCLHRVSRRTAGLMEGIRSKRPLLSLDMEKECQELVEISDSESDSDGEDAPNEHDEILTADTVQMLEEQLATMLNETWQRCGMAEQLASCEKELMKQLEEVQKGFDEVNGMLATEQATMDRIRNELYSTFASEVRELEPIDIDDGAPHTPLQTPHESDASDTESRRSKRQRKQVNYEERSTRSPIPLGYQTLEVPQPANTVVNTARDSDSPVIVDVKLAPKPADDNADVSVVKLSAESAPAGLPAPGELQRTPLKVGDAVYAVRQSTIGSWALARLLEVWPPAPGSASPFTQAKIRFEHKLKGASVRLLSGKEIAYLTAAPVRLTIGTRVIALFKDLTNTVKRESYYSGIIAEPPTPVNSYRYLVFFDDGYAQYVQHSALRVVYETSARVWEDVHPDSREFVQKYLVTYPERPMVRLSAGQALKSEWNGKWWISRVVCVDASLVQVLFESDGRVEWIYRGSTRLAPLYLELQAAERHRPRGLSRLNKPAPIKANMPYVEYTRSDEQEKNADNTQTVNAAQEESRRREQQRAVAKKSTTPQVYAPQRPSGPQPLDNLMTRVVYYSPKAAVKPNKMVPHTCSVHCRRNDVLPLKELKTYNPLTRPLLTGWERQIMRCKGKKVVMYRSPCGRRIRDMSELHRYLRAIQSDCSVDLFDFNPMTHCLAEFVLNKCYVSKKDLSYGKENVPVPCVNYYDGSLPEYCVYNTERTPTAGVPLNLDPEFLCGCDCTDDCVDKTKCACWKLTLEGARTIGMEGTNIGYEYKRLPEPLLSGIYECNSRCKCAQTCLNRVAQHPLQLKLQVFKTFNRGWGIRALNDVPKGAFLCVYAGNLLTDATANLDGLNEGDEYLAELDYIEVVERLKEGYESDVAEERDKKNGSDSSKSDEEDDEEEEENERRQSETDADFRPDYITPTFKFTKRLRNRKKDKDKEKEKKEEGVGRKEGGDDDQFITISDDEEVREPSRFTAQAGLDEDDYVPRHRSVREAYGKDEACYIMDAKVQGNIGRYLNHSCTPNVFVQNVFVDTHDPRFPWVAFFALSHIQAGSELTWNYNYDIGSVPNKIMYCKCGAPNCRGRLL